METPIGTVAALLIRQHRRLRSQLPRFSRLAHLPSLAPEAGADRTARRAAAFLSQIAEAGLDDLLAPVAGALRRAARPLELPVGDPLRLSLELVPVVAAPRVLLLTGRLRSNELETVLAPVDLELALVPHARHTTRIDVRWSMAPTRAVPSDAAAHTLTPVAVHALVGQLAHMAADRHPDLVIDNSVSADALARNIELGSTRTESGTSSCVGCRRPSTGSTSSHRAP